MAREVLPWWNPDGATPGGVGGSTVGAYQAKSAASYPASLINLANPSTNDLVEGNGAVPWAAGTGWGLVNAAQQYFDTGIVPILNPVTWSVLIQYSNMAAGTFSPFGLLDTIPVNGGFWCQHWTAGGAMRCRHGNFNISSNAPTLTSGNYGFAAKQPYRNGVAEGVAMAAGVGLTDLSIFLGAFSSNGVSSQWPTFDCEAFVVYNVTLTAPQVLARATAMAAL
jgi:hypothetical protein